MAKKPSYYEQLKDPRWQRKRLEIMEDAGFSCVECGDEESTLNVHHTYYEKGKAPWEYPDESLRCLCEQCHEFAEVIRMRLLRTLGRLSYTDLHEILGMAYGMEMAADPSLRRQTHHHPHVVEGMVRVFMTANMGEVNRRAAQMIQIVVGRGPSSEDDTLDGGDLIICDPFAYPFAFPRKGIAAPVAAPVDIPQQDLEWAS